jgi:hypothetical protein
MGRGSWSKLPEDIFIYGKFNGKNVENDAKVWKSLKKIMMNQWI